MEADPIILASTAPSLWDVVALFLVLPPLTVLWVVAIVDLFQRENLNRRERGAWLIIIIAVPVFGALSCLLVRPGTNSSTKHVDSDDFGQSDVPRPAVTRAGQLYILAGLHDTGKITTSEFTAAKARVLRDDVGSAYQSPAKSDPPTARTGR